MCFGAPISARRVLHVRRRSRGVKVVNFIAMQKRAMARERLVLGMNGLSVEPTRSSLGKRYADPPVKLRRFSSTSMAMSPRGTVDGVRSTVFCAWHFPQAAGQVNVRPLRVKHFLYALTPGSQY